jgi:hypothetical protein
MRNKRRARNLTNMATMRTSVIINRRYSKIRRVYRAVSGNKIDHYCFLSRLLYRYSMLIWPKYAAYRSETTKSLLGPKIFFMLTGTCNLLVLEVRKSSFMEPKLIACHLVRKPSTFYGPEDTVFTRGSLWPLYRDS